MTVADISVVSGRARKSDQTDLVAAFSEWYEPYHHVSPHRALIRRRLLDSLAASLDHSISELSAHDVEMFLGARPVAPATILREIKMMRPWFKWLWQHGHITAEQFMRLKDVSAPRGAGAQRPRPYTRREIAEFWEDFDAAYPWSREKRVDYQTPRRGEYWTKRFLQGRSSWERVQPYARRLQAEAIVSLVLFGGLRQAEAFTLELDDMHYENAYVRVLGARKNAERESYMRAVPITEPMAVALANWLEFRAQVLQPLHERPWLRLWTGGFSDPMSSTAFAQTLARVGMGYEMHRMRHTFATERLRAGMKIEVLQKVMGHATIQQTLKYAQITDDDVVREADLTNDKFAANVQRQHEIMR